MSTQYEKNSIYIAKLNYGMKRKKKELASQLVLFFAGLLGVCAALYLIISYLPY